jgi:RNA polymerase sigma-70 factor, ECF subfamily
MSNTRTATALLDGLFNLSDREAWSEFDRRYRPIVLAVARKLGLDDADAADAAQETIFQFVRDYRAGRFDRSRGRLRDWIAGIARHRIADIHRRASARGVRLGESAFDQAIDDRSLEEYWEQACRQEMILHAFEEVRRTATGEKSLAVFDLLFVRQLSPGQVAAQMGVTVQEVYVHKSRLAAKLRRLVQAQEALFDGPES